MNKTQLDESTGLERPVSATNKAQHSTLPWRLEIGEGACFHNGNRVSIVHDFTDGDEKCLSTVAEVWPTDGDQDIADGKLIVRAVNHADKLAEALRDVTTAGEIVDGCETPDKSDIEHMLNCFEKAHSTLANYEAAQ